MLFYQIRYITSFEQEGVYISSHEFKLFKGAQNRLKELNSLLEAIGNKGICILNKYDREVTPYELNNIKLLRKDVTNERYKLKQRLTNDLENQIREENSKSLPCEI